MHLDQYCSAQDARIHRIYSFESLHDTGKAWVINQANIEAKQMSNVSWEVNSVITYAPPNASNAVSPERRIFIRYLKHQQSAPDKRRQPDQL